MPYRLPLASDPWINLPQAAAYIFEQTPHLDPTAVMEALIQALKDGQLLTRDAIPPQVWRYHFQVVLPDGRISFSPTPFLLNEWVKPEFRRSEVQRLFSEQNAHLVPSSAPGPKPSKGPKVEDFLRRNTDRLNDSVESIRATLRENGLPVGRTTVAQIVHKLREEFRTNSEQR